LFSFSSSPSLPSRHRLSGQFRFRILKLWTWQELGRTTWTGNQLVIRPLTKKIECRHPCLEWDSNPRPQCLSGHEDNCWLRQRGHCDSAWTDLVLSVIDLQKFVIIRVKSCMQAAGWAGVEGVLTSETLQSNGGSPRKLNWGVFIPSSLSWTWLMIIGLLKCGRARGRPWFNSLKR
jgi:hypothetical protein